MKYVWDSTRMKWVEPHQQTVTVHAGPYIHGDWKPVKSPITGEVLEGRAAVREALKRNDCRIVEKGEFRPEYHNENFARKRGLG